MTLEHELKNETIGRRIDRLGTQFPSKVVCFVNFKLSLKI